MSRFVLVFTMFVSAFVYDARCMESECIVAGQTGTYLFSSQLFALCARTDSVIRSKTHLFDRIHMSVNGFNGRILLIDDGFTQFDVSLCWQHFIRNSKSDRACHKAIAYETSSQYVWLFHFAGEQKRLTSNFGMLCYVLFYCGTPDRPVYMIVLCATYDVMLPMK